jgi:hypothetical protein
MSKPRIPKNRSDGAIHGIRQENYMKPPLSCSAGNLKIEIVFKWVNIRVSSKISKTVC